MCVLCAFGLCDGISHTCSFSISYNIYSISSTDWLYYYSMYTYYIATHKFSLSISSSTYWSLKIIYILQKPIEYSVKVFAFNFGFHLLISLVFFYFSLFAFHAFFVLLYTVAVHRYSTIKIILIIFVYFVLLLCFLLEKKGVVVAFLFHCWCINCLNMNFFIEKEFSNLVNENKSGLFLKKIKKMRIFSFASGFIKWK